MLPWLRPWPVHLRVQLFGPTQTQRHVELFPSGSLIHTHRPYDRGCHAWTAPMRPKGGGLVSWRLGCPSANNAGYG
jgi:hypothetical protein